MKNLILTILTLFCISSFGQDKLTFTKYQTESNAICYVSLSAQVDTVDVDIFSYSIKDTVISFYTKSTFTASDSTKLLAIISCHAPTLPSDLVYKYYTSPDGTLWRSWLDNSGILNTEEVE